MTNEQVLRFLTYLSVTLVALGPVVGIPSAWRYTQSPTVTARYRWRTTVIISMVLCGFGIMLDAVMLLRDFPTGLGVFIGVILGQTVGPFLSEATIQTAMRLTIPKNPTLTVGKEGSVHLLRSEMTGSGVVYRFSSWPHLHTLTSRADRTELKYLAMHQVIHEFRPHIMTAIRSGVDWKTKQIVITVGPNLIVRLWRRLRRPKEAFGE